MHLSLVCLCLVLPRFLNLYHHTPPPMVRKLDVNLNNKEFIINALKANKRLDGRSLLEARPLDIEFGAPLGCVTIKLGECKWV